MGGGGGRGRGRAVKSVMGSIGKGMPESWAKARACSGRLTFSGDGLTGSARSTVEMTGYASLGFCTGDRGLIPSLLSRRMNGLSEIRDLGDSSLSLPEGSLARAEITGSGALATIFGVGEVGAAADFCSHERWRTGGSHGMRPSLACAAF